MTKLEELVSNIHQKSVFIQTHNFPDPDAIASAYGLKRLLNLRGIDAAICYRGKVERLSIRKMQELLNIEIINIDEMEQSCEDREIIIVDAQKGNSNITVMEGVVIGCIDHHPTYEKTEYRFSDIRQGVGACASIIASYFMENNENIDCEMATALMYGIRIDTANMTRGVGQMDLDVFYHLYNRCNQDIIRELESSNLQFEDLNAYANAIHSICVFETLSFANAGSDCPEPLVARISDFMLSLASVEFSVVYSVRPDGIKLSVRSSRMDMDAGDITVKALKGIGSGGGHASMAGGFVPFGAYADKKALLIEEIQKRFIQETTEK
jgi:nanoRNase/pAp phosphatase (c-di-AMP/oligoRNAs hydrolase)